jgi:hypothetical protein
VIFGPLACFLQIKGTRIPVNKGWAKSFATFSLVQSQFRMVDTPTLLFLPKSGSILSGANLTPPYLCFAYSVLRLIVAIMSSKHIMPATIAPHATTTPPCHRPLPKWHEHHCHYTVVSIFKRSTSPSTFTTQSCIHWSHHLPSPSSLSSCFLSAHTCHFRRLRHSSPIKLLPLSIPTI